MPRSSGGSRGSRGGSRGSSGGSRGYYSQPAHPSRQEPPRRSSTHTKETIIVREAPVRRWEGQGGTLARPGVGRGMPIREEELGQPGLFGTMAATAGGVAVGSAVGTAVGDAITGGGRRESSGPGPPPEQQYVGPTEPTGPCAWEIKQFLHCAQNNDLAACEGFNEAIKACKAKFGLR